MATHTYLTRLTERLTAGLNRLAPTERSRHVGYLIGKQNPDGGWSGREGESDLYYSALALRGLAVLEALTPSIAGSAGAFLRSSLSKETTVVDFYSLLYACLLVQAAGGGDVLADSPANWPDRVATTLESFRTSDGGYNKGPGSLSGSTYHCFLVGLVYEVLGRGFPQPEQVASFVLSRRREDGGFVEVAPMRRSGTNPTAAAVGTLMLTNSLTDDVARGVADYLAEMPSDEGGLRANGRVPVADLLSTFTACWTLADLGALDRINGPAVAAYARYCARPEGGFHGGLWDEGHDVEYTFYGLGVLGLFG